MVAVLLAGFARWIRAGVLGCFYGGREASALWLRGMLGRFCQFLGRSFVSAFVNVREACFAGSGRFGNFTGYLDGCFESFSLSLQLILETFLT